MRHVPALIASAVVIAAILVVDRLPSDDAGQVTLALILLGSLALGAWIGRRAWLIGLVLGSIVALSRAVSLAAGAPPPGAFLPPGWIGIATLLVLVIPAVAAAYLGTGLRRLLTREVAPPAA